MDYELPSSFTGGIQQAQSTLASGGLPQLKQSPVIKPSVLPKKKYTVTFSNWATVTFDWPPKKEDIDHVASTPEILNYWQKAETPRNAPFADIHPEESNKEQLLKSVPRWLFDYLKWGYENLKQIAQWVGTVVGSTYEAGKALATWDYLSSERNKQLQSDITTGWIQALSGLTGTFTDILPTTAATKIGYNITSEAPIVQYIPQGINAAVWLVPKWLEAIWVSPENAQNLTNIAGNLAMIKWGVRGQAEINAKPWILPKLAETARQVPTTIKGTIQAPFEAINALTKSNPFKKNVKTLEGVNLTTKQKENIIQAKERGFNPIEDIAKHQEIIPEVTKEGRIVTKWDGWAISRLEDILYGVNDKLTQSIAKEGVKIPLDEFKARSIKLAQKYAEEWTPYNSILKQINSDFEVYKRYADEQGRIDLAKINEIKKTKYGISNYTDQTADKGNKVVGKAAKELVEENAKWTETQAINRELSRWYSVRDTLEALDNKVVKGGRFGKYSAKFAGNLIGAYFWPLGSFAGGEIASVLQGNALRNATSGTWQKIELSDTLKNIGKKETPLLPSSSVNKTVEQWVQLPPAQEVATPSKRKARLPKK